MGAHSRWGKAVTYGDEHVFESDLSGFEDLESFEERISSHIEECRLQGVCPSCGGPCSPGFGTGRMSDGVFCSLECFRSFRDEYHNRLKLYGLN